LSQVIRTESGKSILSVPETMTLVDLGYESWNLTMIAPDTEDTKTGMRRAEKLGMHAMEASETRIAPRHAKAVESP
jgi:hypothetical protein